MNNLTWKQDQKKIWTRGKTDELSPETERPRTPDPERDPAQAKKDPDKKRSTLGTDQDKGSRQGKKQRERQTEPGEKRKQKQGRNKGGKNDGNTNGNGNGKRAEKKRSQHENTTEPE